MELTGQEFDMDPKTFTLGAMFAMQLDKVAEEVAKICSAAVKELTVRGLRAEDCADCPAGPV